jgi:hypothetical protein
MGSNFTQSKDVCPRLSVLCCPGKIEALTEAKSSLKE